MCLCVRARSVCVCVCLCVCVCVLSTHPTPKCTKSSNLPKLLKRQSDKVLSFGVSGDGRSIKAVNLCNCQSSHS